ncbi:restriction endonuclease subunit S [Lactococcus lactis]|nr:restriction endonuclease subunit S [Lactococcus lactis]MDG4965784.1 restriction endonuclease subunit S [Lactococcus lactis]
MRKLEEISDKVTEKNNNSEFIETLTNSAEFGIINQRDFFDKDISNEKNLNGYYIVRDDDFVYNPRISNYAPVGPIKRNKLGRTGVISPLYYVFRPHDIDKKFLEYYFDTTVWHKFMKINGDSGARADRFAIKDSIFKTMPIPYPSIEEQRKIGKFFDDLNDTIALHQRKLDKLKRLKQGYLQRLFPQNGEKVPRLRFTNFIDEWKQHKLSEIATMNARIGWQNLRTSEFLDSGDYMLITGTDFKDGKIDYSSIHYVEKERYDQDKKIQIKNDSILITKDGTLGKVAYIEGLNMPATLNAGVFNVRVKENDLAVSQYLFHYLKAPFLLKYAAEQSTGGTIKHLNQNVLVDFPIPLPIKQEQHKLGQFFKQLDDTITLHQSKLAKLKSIKQAFLQKMFI